MAQGFKVKVKMNTHATKQVKEGAQRALKKTAQKIYGEKVESQQIPLNEGTLQNIKTYVESGAIKKGKISIVSDVPYALRLYYHPEYNFNHEFNTNAQGLWWEDWLSGDKKDRAIKIYKTYYKREAGGYVK